MNEEVKPTPPDVLAMVEAVSEANTMIIDKVVFDNTILPLLVGKGLGLTIDERWENIKNIWINYYNNTEVKKDVIPNVITRTTPSGARTVEKSILPQGGLYATMSIVDINGKVIATTPPLMNSEIINGSTDIFLEYKNTSNVNKMLAGRELSKNMNSKVEKLKTTSNAWGDFLDYYIPTHTEGIVDGVDNVNESNDGDSLLMEY